MNKKSRNHIIVVILKSVLLLLLTVAIAGVSRFLFLDGISPFKDELRNPEKMLDVWYTVLFFLIFNSLFISIKQHDKYSREKFLERVKNNNLISHLKYIVTSVDIYIEIGIITVISLLLPVNFLYNFVSKVFFYGVELTAEKNKLYTLLIIIPIMFVLLFVSRITIQKNWYKNAQKEKLGYKKDKKPKIPPTVKGIIIVAIIYCGASTVIPWFLPFFISLWNLGEWMLLVWIAVILVAVILVSIIAYYIRAILKRRSFIKKLKRYCVDNSVYISNIKKPYASIFKDHAGYDFSIENNGVKYDCKFFAGVFPGDPIVFSDKGNGLKQHTFWIFKVDVFHIMTKFDFGYESDGKKILILLPIPRNFYVSVNGSPPRPADVGEKAGEYTIYNSTGFLGALDRNCL